jgi:hypothetical protein
MPSHADDDATEFCWQWSYRGDLTVMGCRCRVTLTAALPSHDGDGAVESCW